MSPSRPFIERPVATALLMLAIVLAGLLGLRFLPLSALPEVDYPTIQVQTLYPGASPEVMGRTVSAPLERQFGQMPGLERMASRSSAGVSVITLQFSLGLALDVAEQQVQAAINVGSALLPADLPAPPVYAKVNPADAPVLTLAISSQTLPLSAVQNLVYTRLAPKISQVSGVGLVSLAGGQRPAVRIQADTRALASYGLGLDSLRTAITAANANGAKGSFDGPQRAYTIDTNDQLLTAQDYRDLIVSWRNGAPVRMHAVARVLDGVENERLGAWANTTPAIILDVQRQPGANVIATVERIRQLLPALQADLPVALEVQLLADRTTGIRAAVEHVELELVLAVLLVVLVIFFFLHSLRATVIASLAVPISLVGSCGVMYLLGYGLNNLSLMALTIATGFVVDDAIVMLENIARHLEAGETPLQAARKGAAQIGFTIVSLTVSLIAVLIPLLFMRDVLGRLFREFAVTLAVSIILSAVVSLTLVPMLAARWLHPEPAGSPRGLAGGIQRGFERLIAGYDRWLQWVLRHQGTTLALAWGTLALTALLYLLIPKGLFPTQDTGQLQARIEAASDVSFARMAALQQAAVHAILQDPDVRSVSAFVGVDGVHNTLPNTGSMLINLKDRHDAQQRVMDRLRARVQAVAGVTPYLQPTQDLRIDTETGPTEYRVSIGGVDAQQVDGWTRKLVQRLQGDPRLRNVSTDAGAQGLSAYVDIDRNTAARLALTASSVDDTLYSAFGQRIVSTIFTETNQYRVILEAQREQLDSAAALGQLPLRTGSGQSTPLAAVARVDERLAPLQLTRVAQYPAATLDFDKAQGVSLGSAVDAIRSAAREIGIPRGLSLEFLGAAGAYEKSLSSQLWLILAALVCVYIVLGVLYESYIHPVTILSTLPCAGVGALLALMLSGNELGVIGVIGIILLIGIVKKNAIMMIDFAIDAQRRQNLAPQQAIHQAALLRFRPILMTTLAALFAALPLMFGWGAGAELRRPLGLAIFGGLVLSQLLTLFTTPVIYLAFDRLGRRWTRAARVPSGAAP
ncbi:multidrug transporter subunit MdtC [Verminephrobacter aporrectodeae subsp. tuberculatae]|uniref:efflux RND transporter permease subunit n=1 Tax=Verminephrobacter aporrectodeae TaxID=1110389 RepID=UPI0022430A39|nr:efflux RND transporter permease subunit [Verminephrobacter aporrectodeae]MCW8208960.1 multidrug transporter subunit MdtC [Verminephrobacter aporrectodeae subsp. tuberculatae]